MKNVIVILVLLTLFSCGQQQSTAIVENASPESAGGGQSTVSDSDSAPNVVQVAVGSADHSTLVAAVKAGELVDHFQTQDPSPFMRQPSSVW